MFVFGTTQIKMANTFKIFQIFAIFQDQHRTAKPGLKFVALAEYIGKYRIHLPNNVLINISLYAR